MTNLFLPGAENGLAARRRIEVRLATSIGHVLDQCRGIIPFDEAAGRALIDLLESPRRVHPAIFGAFFTALRIIEALHRDAPPEADEAAAVALARLLDGPIAAREGISVRPLTPSAFTSAEEDSLRSQFVSESLSPEQIVAMDDHAAAIGVGRVERMLGVIAEHAPATYSEMRHVIAEIVLTGDPGPQYEGDFAACSSLERWGSILVNPASLVAPLDLADALMHESAHSYLYGASPTEFHVRNPIEERYPSPLRKDPRPLDGIYHATFVLARTCFSMREFAASETLESAMRKQARDRASECVRLFWNGHAVLEEHAAYTEEGRALMRDARDYMAGLQEPVSV